MADDQHTLAESIFHAASAMTGEERELFLAERCGQDTELRGQVLRLLAHHEVGMGSSFLRPDHGEGTPTVETERGYDKLRWGGLELIERIGEGSFGETFRARDPWLDREVALKLLKAGARDRESVERRVIREGVLLARVSHPNVVTVYGAERHEGRVGMWMELVRGQALNELLRMEGELVERDCLLVGLDLSRALAAVHAAGIVHRDVKCENVMRADGGRIVLMDFGAGVEPAREHVASLSGTPLYMAPEIFRGEPASVRSDLYSVGVVLFRLLTNTYPMTAATLHDLFEAHEQGDARHVQEERPDLSAGFSGLIERCLRRDPAERFASAAELESAIAGIVESAGSPKSFDFTAWRHGRIAQWSRPRYRLDTDFVALSLLIDQGEETTSDRWRARLERYRDLREILTAAPGPVLVLLGPPGSGKSTLLRRLELDLAEAAIMQGGSEAPVTFFIQLNHYRAPSTGEAAIDPGEWLADRWKARYPELPSLQDMLVKRRMVLLLDALNEIPAPDPSSHRRAIAAWKGFLEHLAEEQPDNRTILSCRTLDYSASLSTPRLRVPQVVVEPMTDEQVEQYLVKNAPEMGAAIWEKLSGTPQLEVMRSPYFLSLLVQQVAAEGEMPQGRAALFTGFIRHALKREVERDNPLFAANALLTERDIRRITRWRWRSQWELPERGALVPKLSDLAFGMQDASMDGGASQVRIGFDQALELLDSDLDEDIIRAGVALSVLDEDVTNEQLLFFHQLVQEYFAGRRLAVDPQPERLRVIWKAAEISPSLRETLASLPSAETLPGLPQTGWEETSLLASVMAPDPNVFVRGLMESNLGLAGHCAGQAEIRDQLERTLLHDLRGALVARSRDTRADLRARLEAALALGPLGDPRLQQHKGPHGPYLLPELIALNGGYYPIGDDRSYEYLGQTIRNHVPRHEVEIRPFRLACFPVTNAEWALFLESGGYEEERWWDTEGARRWRRGEGTADGQRLGQRYWLARFRTNPEQLDNIRMRGEMSGEGYELWRKRLVMTDQELDAHLKEMFPGGTLREPDHWHDVTFNNPTQPVTGICWFEARAYCAWLSSQTGETFRLPSEVEWEAAARGRSGRVFPYGDTFDPLRGNTIETRLRRTTPVGIFREGDTPEGISDLAGNVAQCTLSLFGPGMGDDASYSYPYRSDDGRENPSAATNVRRVLRGGAWLYDSGFARSTARHDFHPAHRFKGLGLRVACSE